MMEVNEQEILASRLEDGTASRLTTLAFMFVMGSFCSANTLKSVDYRDIVYYVASLRAVLIFTAAPFIRCFLHTFHCLNWPV